MAVLESTFEVKGVKVKFYLDGHHRGSRFIVDFIDLESDKEQSEEFWYKAEKEIRSLLADEDSWEYNEAIEAARFYWAEDIDEVEVADDVLVIVCYGFDFNL